MKMKTLVIVGLILLIVVLCTFVRTYRVRNNADADLLWNADEAYIFINVASRGYRPNYIQYLADLVKERWGGVTMPDDEAVHSMVVLHLTPTGSETYKVEKLSFDFFTPFEGVIYANNAGDLWKWAGGHFERVTAPERSKLENASRQLQVNFTNLDGWSKYSAVLNRRFGRSEFPLNIGGKPATLIVKKSLDTADVSIDLERAGEPPKRLWSESERTRSVHIEQYHRLFGSS